MVKDRIRAVWLWSRQNPLTIVLVVSALFAWGGIADNRHDTQVIEETVQTSPCTIDPAGEGCQSAKRGSDRERTLADTCIPFQKALTAEAYRTDTRCPGEEVVAQQGSSPSQQPGPSGGRPSVPSRPSTPTEPTKPVTPSEPAVPEPTSPSPESVGPVIDLRPVTKPVCDLTRPIAAIC